MKRLPRLPEIFGTGQQAAASRTSTKPEVAWLDDGLERFAVLRRVARSHDARFKQKQAEKLRTKMGTQITETLCFAKLLQTSQADFFQTDLSERLEDVSCEALRDEEVITARFLVLCSGDHVQISFNFKPLFDHWLWEHSDIDKRR